MIFRTSLVESVETDAVKAFLKAWSH